MLAVHVNVKSRKTNSEFITYLITVRGFNSVKYWWCLYFFTVRKGCFFHPGNVNWKILK